MNWRAQGFRAWLLQRLTAAYMVLFTVWFSFAILISTPDGFQQWSDWMGGTTTAIATSIFFLALLMHAWIGLRDVVIDYVRPFAWRFSILCILALSLLFMALWVLRVLFRATL